MKNITSIPSYFFLNIYYANKIEIGSETMAVYLKIFKLELQRMFCARHFIQFYFSSMTVHLDPHCYLALTTFQTNDVGFPARRVIRKRYQNPWKKFCKLDWLHERSTADPYSLSLCRVRRSGLKGKIPEVFTEAYAKRLPFSKRKLGISLVMVKRKQACFAAEKRVRLDESNSPWIDRVCFSPREIHQLHIKLNSSTKVQFIKYS